MTQQTVTFTSSTNWTVPTKAYLLDVFAVGAGGNGGYNGGGGGAGGRVTRASGYAVTPGTTVAVAIGGSGSGNGATGGTSSFGSISAAGGTGGNNGQPIMSGGGGSGGASSQTVYGVTSNFSGGYGYSDGGGGGGASPAGNGNAAFSGVSGTGAVGYLFNGSFYGGGGGGGCRFFDQNTGRPIPGAPGGAGGGGQGGGEGFAGSAGAPNTGGGGGGGAHSGYSTARDSLTNNNDSPAAPYTAVAATNGGLGGSGIVIIRYDEAEAVLTTSQPGVAEGDSIIVYLKTKNIPNGVTLGYTLSGTGILANDFNPATLTGSFTVSSSDGGLTGVAQITISIATDAGITEGEDLVTVSLNNGLASTFFKIGDRYQNPITIYADIAGQLVIGESYTIVSVGTTDFVALGAASNTVGITFTATGTGLVPAGSLISGKSYTISNPGNTDFTKFGAGNNSAGTTFTATGTGFQLATATVYNGKYTIMSLGNTDFTAIGAGWLSAVNLQLGATYIIKSVGDTPWISMGAPDNNIGTSFVLRVAGTGTGMALPSGYTPAVGTSFTASGAGTGTGTVMPIVTLATNSPLGNANQGNGTVTGIMASKTIQVADFNDVQSRVANILGSGTGSSGYGQTVLSSQITTSSRVSINDWSNLRYDIINAYYHQVGTTPSVVLPTVGDTVTANTVSAPYRQYAVWGDVVSTLKFDIAPSQAITRTSSPFGGGAWSSSQSWPGTQGSYWNTRLYCIVNVYWNNAAAARYFFNSGGEIRFTSERTGGTGAYPAQNSSWTTLLTSSGTQAFGGNKPVLDAGAMNGGNYYRLTDGFQVWYSNAATNPYSSNTYRILARSPGVTNNNQGTAASIEFQVEWLDYHVQSGSTPEGVDGTFKLALSTLEASGVLVGGAGTFTVQTPTITFSQPITSA